VPTARIASRRLQLFAVMVVAEVALLVTSVTWVDAVAAIPLVLVIPGMAILGSLESDRPRLPFGDAFIWSVVMSFGSAVAGGLVLNLLGGLTRRNWLIYTALVVTIATFVSVRTTVAYGLDDEGAEATAGIAVVHRTKGSVGRVNFSLRNLATALVGVVVLGASFALSYQSAASTRERFTQLWLIPSGPTPAVSRTQAKLGMQNHEGASERYTVALFEGSGTTATTTWTLTLDDGATWTHSIPRPTGTSLRVTLTYGTGDHQQVQYVTLQSTT
jgi:uncharacterized membrane protein